MKHLQGKLQQSNSSQVMVLCADTVVGTGKSMLKARTADQLVSMSPGAKRCSIDQPMGPEYRECIFPQNPRPSGKENIMVKTGFIGDQFSNKWCHFFTTILLFNQVIHHNDKVMPKSCLVSL